MHYRDKWIRIPAFDKDDLEKAIKDTEDDTLQLKYYKLIKEYEVLHEDSDTASSGNRIKI